MSTTTANQVKQVFQEEFGPIAEKFETFELVHVDFRNSSLTQAARPGTYVWWDGERFVRVGVSLINARARALQHIRDNTGGICSGLAENQNARLILFTVEPRDIHWAAALEVYLENKLDPVIPSKRLG